ncbi:azurin [Dokdonia sp. Asnod1-B02]|jgi:azurin|uniref:azurin n=1 Tax=Dokdonia sp. Asnod1-B02 TaxID=3160573 RepID=UPI0038642A89
MRIKGFLAVIALATIMVSCGEGEKKETKETVKIGSKKAATKADENTVNLALAGNDLMKYDKSELKAKAGQEVTLTFRHTGKIGIKVMGHNFVLLKQGTSIPEFSAAAATAGEAKDWIANEDQIIAHTKMIGGGQTTSVTFTAPAAGTYDFICSFPGHSGLMKGKFIVE